MSKLKTKLSSYSSNQNLNIQKASKNTMLMRSKSNEETTSKYFKSIEKSQSPASSEHESPNKKSFNNFDDTLNDFQTPILIKKRSKLQIDKPAKEKIQKQSKKGKNKQENMEVEKPPKNYKFSNEQDFNPDHLQLAIALSKSCFEAEHPDAKTNDNTSTKNTSLKQYGFRNNIIPENRKTNRLNLKKKSKRSRYRYVTPVLYIRTTDDREMIIAKKISIILMKNNAVEDQIVLSEHIKPSSSFLKECYSSETLLMKLNSLTLEELNNKKDIFYTKTLNLPQLTMKCGTMLNDWSKIPGREMTPTRNIKKTHEFGNKNAVKASIDSGILYSSFNEVNKMNKPVSGETTKEIAERTEKKVVEVIELSSDEERQDLKQLKESSQKLATEKALELELLLSKDEDNVKIEVGEMLNKVNIKIKEMEQKEEKSVLKITKSTLSRNAVPSEIYYDDEKNNDVTVKKRRNIGDVTPDLFESEDEILAEDLGATITLKDVPIKRKDYLKKYSKYSLSPLKKLHDETIDVPILETTPKRFDTSKAFISVYSNSKHNVEKPLKKDSLLKKSLYCLNELNKNNEKLEEQDLPSSLFNKLSNSISLKLNLSQMKIIQNSSKEFKEKQSEILLVKDEVSLGLDIPQSLDEKDHIKLNESIRERYENILEISKNIEEKPMKSYKENEGLVSTNDVDASYLSNDLNVTGYINKILTQDTTYPVWDLTNSSDESIYKNDEELNYSSKQDKSFKERLNYNSFDLSYSECDEEVPSPTRLSPTSEYCIIDSPKTSLKPLLPCQHLESFKTTSSTTLQSSHNDLGFPHFRLQNLLSLSADFPKTDISSLLSNNMKISTQHKRVTELKIQTPPNKKFIIKTQDITPMLHYDAMNTPEIIKELNKFGLKPLRKKRGRQILKHIYEATHPIVGSKRNSPINVEAIESKRQKIESNENIKEFKTAKEGEINTNKKDIKIEIIEDLELNENLLFEKKQSSKKFYSCKIPLDIVWHNFLSCNPKIKENILLYEPLKLEVIHSMLKKQGFKFNVQDLVTFFDKKCITIRTSSEGSG